MTITDPNALADLVVGYMGVPYEGVDMTSHRQYVTVRNGRGRELLDSIKSRLEVNDAWYVNCTGYNDFVRLTNPLLVHTSLLFISLSACT